MYDIAQHQPEDALDNAVTIMQEVYAGTPRPGHCAEFRADMQQIAEAVEQIRAQLRCNPRNHYRPYLLRSPYSRYQPRYPVPE